MAQTNNLNRNSSLELLRILSAMLIVVGHSASKGGGLLGTEGVNNVFAHLFSIGGNLGSNTLAVMGFYFLTEQGFRSKSFLRIWCLTIYYYIIITLGVIVVGGVEFSPDMLYKGLPVIQRPYWFVTAYLVVMVFSPYINYSLNNLSDSSINRLLIISFFLFSIVRTVASNSVVSNELTLFYLLYLIVFWLFRRNGVERIKCKKKVCMFLGGIALLLMFIGGIIIQWIYNVRGLDVDINIIARFSGKDAYSVLMIYCACIIFVMFLSRKTFTNRIINWISQSALSVYLFHVHPYIKNDYIWEIFKYDSYYNSVWFPVYTIFLAILFLGIAIILDIPERLMFNKIIENKKVKQTLKKIDIYMNNIMGQKPPI